MIFCSPRTLRLLTVLGICLGAAGSAVATEPLQWKVLAAVTPTSDDLVTGAFLSRNGDLLAQLHVTHGKPGTGTAEENRYIRIRSNGSLQWLAHTATLDPGGLLNETEDGGWYSTSATPSLNAANADLQVRCWNANGQLRWSRSWNGPTNQKDVPQVTATDTAGNLLIAGGSAGQPAVWKYDDEGTLLWWASYPKPGSFSRMEVDGADRIAAAGTLDQSNDGFVVTVYDSDGGVAWTDEYQDEAHSREHLTALGLSPEGDVYVSGLSGASSKYQAGTNTVRYSPNGDLLWSRRYTNPDLFELTPTGLVVNDRQEAFVSITGSHPKRRACVLIKHSPSSEPEWTEQRKNARGLEAPHGNLRIDARGYVHAFRMTTRGSRRLIVSTYQDTGDVVRDATHAMGDEPLLVELDAQGNTLAMANPLRGKARKHDVVALKLRRFLNSKQQ